LVWSDIDETVGVAFDTVIVFTTDVPAAYVSLPACAAVSTHEPEDTSVSVDPVTVQTLVVDDVTVGVRPEVAENESAIVFVE